MRYFLRLLTGVFLATTASLSVLHAGEVTRLTLINAETDQPIGELRSGATLDLAKVGGNLNVRADVAGQVGSVRFALDGKNNFRTESTVPFALAGDSKGNYNSWTPSPGKHKIVATPFAQPQAKGAAGSPLVVEFNVVGKAASGLAPMTYPVLKDESVFGQLRIPSRPPEISGELRKWHKITLTFDGPETSETSAPNPFLDYRLNVEFRQGDRSFQVPGYYAADGNAAQTGAAQGNKWRVHFAPDAAGTWEYTVSFRGGNRVAVSDDPQAGTPIRELDGYRGSFEVAPPTRRARPSRQGTPAICEAAISAIRGNRRVLSQARCRCAGEFSVLCRFRRRFQDRWSQGQYGQDLGAPRARLEPRRSLLAGWQGQRHDRGDQLPGQRRDERLLVPYAQHQGRRPQCRFPISLTTNDIAWTSPGWTSGRSSSSMPISSACTCTSS